jgi:hypothetical protein
MPTIAITVEARIVENLHSSRQAIFQGQATGSSGVIEMMSFPKSVVPSLHADFRLQFAVMRADNGPRTLTMPSRASHTYIHNAIAVTPTQLMASAGTRAVPLQPSAAICSAVAAAAAGVMPPPAISRLK